MKHITEAQQFDRQTLELLFASADSFLESNDEPLRGKIMAALFYEPSTRTRFSFESAMLRLGGSVISTENAAEFSSASKGETLEDSIRTAEQYSDIIVLRHPEKGASQAAAAVSAVPVVNAGDGAGQHPTQALLDMYTIQKEYGSIDGVHIAMVGDLKNGRTVRSLVYLLTKYNDIFITFVSPKQLQIGSDIKEYLDKNNVSWKEEETWDAILTSVDVLYQTRVQKERFDDPSEYESLKDSFTLTRKEVDQMKEGAIVMHPLPRVNEIAVDVDDSPKAVYFKQMKNGLYIRMALLQYLLTQ
ncbi:MAG: aspartate carbamoyltransferase catalytic subunit [Candidatus Azotimanducaceae bacterium]|jgi:aspartate carbamoyltransferase catalytic subunit